MVLNKHFIRSTAILFLLVFAVYSRPVCADPQPDEYTYATPVNNIPGLGNFAQVSDELYRGEQPTAEGFAQLKKMGIKTIINLRASYPDAKFIKGLGFYYLYIPMEANNVGDNEAIAFLKAVSDKDFAPFFVHCQHGADRTGTMVGVYRMTVQGWPKEKVQGELSRFGFHEIFFNLRRYLRKVDPKALQNKVDLAPEPEFEYIP